MEVVSKWKSKQKSIPFSVPNLTAFPRDTHDLLSDDLLTSVDQENNNYERLESNRKFGEHMKIGSEFTFRVIILQIIGVVKEYRDIFCQFNFLHRHDEAFSTEPIKNTGKGPPPGFFRIQNITVKVTSAFIDYLKTQPLVFELFGHYQQHPLDREAKDSSVFVPGQPAIGRQPPRRMFPQMIPISMPIRSQRFMCLTAPSTAHVHAKFDILIWLEICELAPNGEYIPVVVDHHDETPCRGTFLLHQGIQRRIRISIIHDADHSIHWKEIKELVVGRVRATPECHEDFDDDDDESVLSLSLFPGEHLYDNEGRCVYRFEAAWDTSLHNTLLLNRVTSHSERIFLTMSAYLDVSAFRKALQCN